MGGFGSGEHLRRIHKKRVVEDCRSIDVYHWRREDILKAGVHHRGNWQWTRDGVRTFGIGYEVNTLGSGPFYVRLSYTIAPRGEQPQSLDYKVQLTTTRVRNGGLRWWFICPLVVSGRPCTRRVGKLYLPPGSKYFGCRACYNLTYTSCQERRKNDSIAKLLARDMGEDPRDVLETLNFLTKRRKNLD
jgi:hypothetical protein